MNRDICKLVSLSHTHTTYTYAHTHSGVERINCVTCKTKERVPESNMSRVEVLYLWTMQPGN